ncbi:protein TolQ [Amorphus orientalis]|uniref:Tol-Pal system protein TolQ n=1 Tax=Amorphus orientalis TaxID=649198 RepID=A0AAE4AQD7_9HYPH|nr:protein TolQ [Amorphus orientalis]MDQ0313961.1 biopolymer transport protein TolQ [Amorphus orientalis]
MESNVAVAGAELAAQAGDFSLLGLFWEAHIVVKLVMLGLISASVWCWAIIVDKWLAYRRTRRQMDRFEDAFWSGQSLEDLFRSLSSRTNTGLAAVFVAAMTEWKRSHEGNHPAIATLGQRLDRVMTMTISREGERLESRLAVLASVGSAGPFIGLFGTVWGIMTSFQAIAVSESTNLAVVAPGIAEALFATALGLLAAIPAVIFFNKLTGDVTKLISRMDGFADEFLAILSREIDERMEGERY